MREHEVTVVTTTISPTHWLLFFNVTLDVLHWALELSGWPVARRDDAEVCFV